MSNQVNGQISLKAYLRDRDNMLIKHCGQCTCKNCLYWWSGRCPCGGCWDDHRAATDPYDKAHPGKPPRTGWSNWDKPEEQAHWCRGGIFYPISYCPHFVKYKGSVVKTCLKCNVQVFQDDYIECSLVDTLGCTACYQEFLKQQN